MDLVCTCSCCTRMRDYIGLPMTGEDTYDLGPLIANTGQESYSFPSQLTEGHWFGRPSVPDVNDLGLNDSFIQGNLWPQACVTSSSSLGSLVCSPAAVSARPPAEHFGATLHTHVAFPHDRSCTNQALVRRGCQNTEVCKGLNLPPVSTANTFLSTSENTSSFVDGGDSTSCKLSTISWNGAAGVIAPDPTLISVTKSLGDLQSSITAISTQYSTSMDEKVSEIASTPLAENNSNMTPALLSTNPIETLNAQGSLLMGCEAAHQRGLISSSPLDSDNPSLPYALVSSSGISNFTTYSNSVGLASHSPGRNKLKERGHYSSSSQPSDSNTEADEASPSISMRVVKEYVCPYSGCRYTARSRKDVRRHLGSEKHKHEQGAELPLINRDNFKCTASNCRSGAKGFSRRDNFMRHMAKVHGIQLDRLKPGRKREIETE